MGICFSHHTAGPGRTLSTSNLAKGSGPYDSVWSVEEKQKQQQANGSPPRKGQPAAADSKQQAKKKSKRVAHLDLATGEVIPDMGVHGVFDVLYELGSGGSGRTYLCRDMASGKVVAVKFVPRPLAKTAIPFMMGEVEIQAELGEGSLNLISMHEIVLTKSHLALVLEYASGGSLTQEVSGLWESALQRGGLFMLEQEASYYLRQFIHAVHYCHSRKVAHRDLKLDNTLLEHCIVGPPRLKICDFGFAMRWTNDNSQMHTAIGTPVYMSPQMLASRQCASGYSGIKADMWAAGIQLFVMLLGTFPFDHDSHTDPDSAEAANEVWLKQQQQGWRKHPRAADVLKRGVLSAECCDLLDRLLEMDEEKRASSAEVLAHPWLHIPLEPEQQAAWERLQEEQAAVDRQLAAVRDPRLVKKRREAMFAMMAIAAKPPSNTLIPAPGALLSAPSINSSRDGASLARADTAGSGGSLAAAAAAAAVTVSSPTEDKAAAAAGGSPALPSPVAAAPASSPTPIGSPTTPAPASPSAAAAAVGDSASTASFSDASSVMQADSRHLSFTEGEGLRSESLELKVEVYRQQCADIKAARVAAAMTAVREEAGGQQQQQQPVEGSVAHSSSNSKDDTGMQIDASPAGGTSTAAVAAAGDAAVSGSHSRKRGLLGWASGHHAPAQPDSSTVSSSKSRGGGSSSKSPFAAAPGSTGQAVSSGAASSAADGSVEDDEEEEEGPDEVWRLPLSSTVDASLFNLTPELAVAAGALVKQLQGSGKIPGRGRASRSSCPMY